MSLLQPMYTLVCLSCGNWTRYKEDSKVGLCPVCGNILFELLENGKLIKGLNLMMGDSYIGVIHGQTDGDEGGASGKEAPEDQERHEGEWEEPSDGIAHYQNEGGGGGA